MKFLNQNHFRFRLQTHSPGVDWSWTRCYDHWWLTWGWVHRSQPCGCCRWFRWGHWGRGWGRTGCCYCRFSFESHGWSLVHNFVDYSSSWLRALESRAQIRGHSHHHHPIPWAQSHLTFGASVQPSVEGTTDPLVEHNSQERTPTRQKKQTLRILPEKWYITNIQIFCNL